MLCGLTAAAAQGQTPMKVEVNIPFEFLAGKVTLQPGKYSIKRMSGNLLALRNSEDNSEVILNAPVTLGSESEKSERLVFKKDGNQYFLTQIWLSVDSGRTCGPREKLRKPSAWRFPCDAANR
jgi:hypothetical protein